MFVVCEFLKICLAELFYLTWRHFRNDIRFWIFTNILTPINITNNLTPINILTPSKILTPQTWILNLPKTPPLQNLFQTFHIFRNSRDTFLQILNIFFNIKNKFQEKIKNQNLIFHYLKNWNLKKLKNKFYNQIC